MSRTSSRLIVCGLGPGSRSYRSRQTEEILASGLPVFLRTSRHPDAELAVGQRSFDYLYERAETFEDVYDRIAELLIDQALQSGDVVYAVPGSPLVLERSVRKLRDEVAARPGDVELQLLPAMSFLDVAWSRLAVDPVDEGVRLIDGHRFASQAAGQPGPMLVAHTHAAWVLSDIKLAVEEPPAAPLVVLQRLGTDDEKITEVPWSELDHIEADHLTTVFIPELAQPVGTELLVSIEMMNRLREQCPWDREQDHASLRKYLREEAYEVLDALDRVIASTADDVGQAYEELESELGDLWFQVLFHARLAAEQGQFTMADVARTLTNKMVERHPHVFDPGVAFTGDVLPPPPATGGDEVGEALDSVASWEATKTRQTGRASVFDGIPPDLPALALADKVLGKAVRSLGEPERGEVRRQVETLVAQLTEDRPVDQAFGIALLEMALAARSSGVDAEHGLRLAIKQLLDELRPLEAASRSGGADEPINRSWVIG